MRGLWIRSLPAAAALTYTLAIVGCGPRFIRGELPLPTLQHRTAGTTVEGGLEITVHPVTMANYRNTRQLSVTLPATEGARVVYSVVPMPAFVVRIVNRTGHVVRLEDAVFRLDAPAQAGSSGERFTAIETHEELLRWARDFYAIPLAKNPGLAPELARAISATPLLTRGSVLLNDDDSTYILAFDLPVRDATAHEEFMRSHPEVVLRIAEIPVAFDLAGTVTQASDVRFAMDRATEAVQVICEPGREMSLATCALVE